MKKFYKHTDLVNLYLPMKENFQQIAPSDGEGDIFKIIASLPLEF
jgi:hypothetical protein